MWIETPDQFRCMVECSQRKRLWIQTRCSHCPISSLFETRVSLAFREFQSEFQAISLVTRKWNFLLVACYFFHSWLVIFRLLLVNEQTIKSNEQDVTNGEQKLTINKEKVTNNEQKLTSNKEKVTNNEQKLTSNKEKVTSNEQKITSNEKKN